MGNQAIATDQLTEAARAAVPQLDRLLELAGAMPIYLVGGTVRDLLLGRKSADLDIVVEGDAAELAQRLGGEVIEHERFRTAKAALGPATIDLASARAESYPSPGELPLVRPAGLLEDLARRDFTINAMAVPLQGAPALIDPHGGRGDLDAGLLRVLHEGSFVDDPTRALRAARYAARFDFDPEPETAALLRRADLATVSADRVEAELRRLAREPEATRGFELLHEWALLERAALDRDLLREADRLLASPPWSEVATREETLLVAARGAPQRSRELAETSPAKPSAGVELARGATPAELALARALGADWLDRYVGEWRSVVLEIGGRDLIEAGVPEGPAVGVGLAAALGAKLDGEIAGREQELATAIEAALGS